MTHREKIVIGLSGGRDSAVCAALLKEEGWEVRGIFLRIGAGNAGERMAAHEQDARKVADHLGITCHAVDVSERFSERVLSPFIRDYMNGRTPNPCIKCNPEVKFHILLDEAHRIGASHMATGHYARTAILQKTKRRAVRRGADSGKDQSYYLARLTQEQIGALVCPAGDLTFDTIRAKGASLVLPVSDKPSSQEICFIEGDYRDFLAQDPRVSEEMNPGEIVDEEGRVLGRHRGLAWYTVGQRSGLGIAHEHPLYVLRMDPARNRLIVGAKKATQRAWLTARDIAWGAITCIEGEIRVNAQIRYRHRPAPATASLMDSGACLKVVFDTPQEAITPGQTVVLYQDELVLAAGTIET